MTVAVPGNPARPSASPSRHPRPPRSARRRIALVGIGLSLVLIVPASSTLAFLRLPAPTGNHGVGRAVAIWSDPARSEDRTPDASDRRSVRIVTWYPTDADAAPGPYLSDLDAVATGLVESGALGGAEVAGLRLVAGHATDGAVVSGSRDRWPVLVLSPGNATNVEFYGALAEELASHGFVVVGVDHPGQVAAVALAGGQVLLYEGDAGRATDTDPSATVVRRIDERVADIRFVLDRVAAGDLPGAGPAVDVDRIGVLGHSNGGIAAAEMCTADPRVDACLNIDGQAAGGPFSAGVDPAPPTKPFLFLTKEASLHPRLAALFETAGGGAYRVVVPAATHDAFADGARFVPRPLPLDGHADHTLRVGRGFATAFFEHVLNRAPGSILGQVDAPTDVLVEVYPLRRG